ncbi:MGMT family protein [Metarhizium anisopliae]|nr:MGMT family protein [Metarhizium anisopliae]
MARSDEAAAFFHAVYSAVQEIPRGKVTSSQPDGAQNQAAALRDEGVHVTRGAMGEFMVDLGEYGWFPRVLPSEAVGDEAWESSTGEEEEGE